MWLGYWLWHCSLNTLPNLSLYSKVTLGRESKDFAGLMMALRFGFKAVGGYFLGQLSLRYGLRAGAMATIGLLAAGILWAWVVPGYPYLLAFGFMGAGELGGAYMPNFGAVISPVAAGPSNLTLLNLSSPGIELCPATHGALADHFGFPASFVFGLFSAALSIWLVMRIRADKLDPFREETEGKDQAHKSGCDPMGQSTRLAHRAAHRNEYRLPSRRMKRSLTGRPRRESIPRLAPQRISCCRLSE